MNNLVWRGIFALVLVMAILMAYRHREALNLVQLNVWVQGWGVAGKVFFVLLYALATTLFMPGSILTLASGALFGPWLGTSLSLIGAGIGSGTAFLISRHLAGDWVARRSGNMAKRLLAGVEAEGWRFVAFARLMPLFPFNLLNYALGLTRIRFDHFLLTSVICMIPGATAYAWLGFAGKEAASGDAHAVQTGLWALGLLALALTIPRWIRRIRPTSKADLQS
ncbi:MAG: TVP38/TMEM64 family protein [Magnetococcales bacterium]|nr:TVP38/TMEM64 family protein [Magnetococcales bacterium]